MTMSKLSCKEAIANRLLELAQNDRDIVVVSSDSRGSASLTKFADTLPQQFVEVGIAEQNLVAIAAGLAACGKKVFAVAPASFLSARAIEQIKVDVGYNHTNVKLIGVSGGISYGPLGLTHHSPNDIAAMTSLPGIRVYLPGDPLLSARLIDRLVQDEEPAYIRVGRSGIEGCYDEAALKSKFMQDWAIIHDSPKGPGTADLLIVSTGEMSSNALAAMQQLNEKGLSTALIDMYSLLPFDRDALLEYARCAKVVLTVEEHSPYGGLNALTAQTLAACPRPLFGLSLPDAPVITGEAADVYAEYRLDTAGIIETACRIFGMD